MHFWQRYIRNFVAFCAPFQEKLFSLPDGVRSGEGALPSYENFWTFLCAIKAFLCTFSNKNIHNFSILYPFPRKIRFPFTVMVGEGLAPPNKIFLSFFSVELTHFLHFWQRHIHIFLTNSMPLSKKNSPRAGSGVVRIDPLRFLAGCRTRRLNQA